MKRLLTKILAVLVMPASRFTVTQGSVNVFYYIPRVHGEFKPGAPSRKPDWK